MLIGKNIRTISHNLIISKYFEEETVEIQNQYFLRNVADELSVISLGFGGFFVAINPCSFAIEYDSDTLLEIGEINLVEVKQFEAKAATVFRIDHQEKLPEFNYDHIRTKLQDAKQLNELDKAIAAITSANAQYGEVNGSLATSFEQIEIDHEALEKANYVHLNEEEHKVTVTKEETQNLEREIARKKQELEALNQELSIQKLDENIKTQDEVQKSSDNSPENTFDLKFDELSKELDQLNEFLNPDDLFLDLEMAIEAEEKDV